MASVEELRRELALLDASMKELRKHDEDLHKRRAVVKRELSLEDGVCFVVIGWKILQADGDEGQVEVYEVKPNMSIRARRLVLTSLRQNVLINIPVTNDEIITFSVKPDEDPLCFQVDDRKSKCTVQFLVAARSTREEADALSVDWV